MVCLIWQVMMKTTTRLCSSKPIATVNGKFPGPTIYAREGDTVLVNVVNHAKYNVSIHWYVISIYKDSHMIYMYSSTNYSMLICYNQVMFIIYCTYIPVTIMSHLRFEHVSLSIFEPRLLLH